MQKSPNQKAKIEPQIHLYKGYHWNFLRLPLGYFLKDFFYVDFFFFFFLVFMEFVTILLLFYVLVFWSQGILDLSSSTRDQTSTPCIGRQSLNHWITGEFPKEIFMIAVC